MNKKRYFAFLILILTLLLLGMLMLPALVPQSGGSRDDAAAVQSAGDRDDTAAIQSAGDRDDAAAMQIAGGVEDDTQVQHTDPDAGATARMDAGADGGTDTDIMMEKNMPSETTQDTKQNTKQDADQATGLNASSDVQPDNGSIATDQKDAEQPVENPLRVSLREGFSKEPLSEEIKRKITGISYHENDTITYDDLNYLLIRYYDFDGNEQIGEMICNQSIADDLLEIFAGLYDAGYRLDKVRLIDEYAADDDLSCADDNTSCFNYRVVAGSTRLSNHAKGLAVDINPFYNPYITHPDGGTRISPKGSEPYADRSDIRPHMIDENDLCYRLFTEHGFTWGGHWKSVKDYQHFEKP